MAQIYNPWQDEKDKQKQQVGTFTTGVGSMNQQPTTAQQKTETQQKPQGSGLFTDIQKFAQQNQGLGQQLGANIQKQTTQAGDQFSGIRDSFQKNQQELAGKFNQGTQFQQQLQQDPTQIAQNEEQLNLFRQLAQGKLGGDIQGLQQYGQQAGQIQQQIGQKLQDVGTEQGRFGLLKDMFGGKKYGQSYGQGQQVLDQALLQTQAGDLTQQVNLAKQQQRDLEQQYGALTGDISTAQETLGTQAQDVSKLLSGELTAQDKALREAQEAERAKYLEQLPTYQKAIEQMKGGQLDETVLKQLGLYNPTKDISDFYGMDISSYLKGTSEQELQGMDWQNFLDEQEASKLSALSNLSVDPETGMAATEYKEGQGYQPLAWQGNDSMAQFLSDLGQRKSDYKRDRDEILNQEQYKKIASSIDKRSKYTDAVDQLMAGKMSVDRFKRLTKELGIGDGRWFLKESRGLIQNTFDDQFKSLENQINQYNNRNTIDTRLAQLESQLRQTNKFGSKNKIQQEMAALRKQKDYFSGIKSEQDLIKKSQLAKIAQQLQKHVSGTTEGLKKSATYQQYDQALKDLAEKYGRTYSTGNSNTIAGIGEKAKLASNYRWNNLFPQKG